MKRFSIWNFYARAYDVINKNVPYLKMLDEVTREMDIRGSLKMLDAGCGTANFMSIIMKNNPTVKIVAVDSSSEMLNRAKKKFLSDQVEFQQVNLEEINFPNNFFDRIVSINVLYLVKDPLKCIEKFYNILKPAGKIVIATLDSQYSFGSIFYAQLRELGWQKFLIKLIRNFPSLLVIIFVNIFFIKKSKYHFFGKEELTQMFTKVGFRIQKVQRTYANQGILISAIK